MEALIVELVAARQLAIRAEPCSIEDLPLGKIAAVTLYSAISPGTEVAAFRGDPLLRPGKAYPRLLGYCNLAEVVAVGKSVTRARVGDLVLTTQAHRSAFVCHEESILATVGSQNDRVQASTAYLYHLAYTALLAGELRPGQHVAVVGLGTLGLATVALAGSFGASVFAFSDQVAARRLAAERGARQTFGKRIEQIGALDTLGTGIDLVITSSNAWDDWLLALRLARVGGTICVLGFPGRGHPLPSFNALDSQYFYDKQLTLRACGHSPERDAPPSELRFTVKRNCEYLLRMMTENRLPSLVRAVVPSSDLGRVYQEMDGKTAPPLTVVLDWTNAV